MGCCDSILPLNLKTMEEKKKNENNSEGDRTSEYLKYYYENLERYGGCAGPTAFLLLVVIIVLFASCSKNIVQPKVPEIPTNTKTEYIHTTDTVLKVDSIIDRQTLIIREVDSLTMARYGIQLKNMEKAWLVESDKLYREIERLRESKSDTVTVHDTIYVPYPVEVPKEVPAELNRWQRLKMKLGIIFLIELVLAAVYLILKIKR